MWLLMCFGVVFVYIDFGYVVMVDIDFGGIVGAFF